MILPWLVAASFGLACTFVTLALLRRRAEVEGLREALVRAQDVFAVQAGEHYRRGLVDGARRQGCISRAVDDVRRRGAAS